jgi:hypothetical protein
VDTSGINDPGSRYGILSTSYGAELGTIEFDGFANHNHPGSVMPYQSFNAGGGGTAAVETPGGVDGDYPLTISPQGGSETRPKNAAVIWAVKY